MRLNDHRFTREGILTALLSISMATALIGVSPLRLEWSPGGEGQLWLETENGYLYGIEQSPDLVSWSESRHPFAGPGQDIPIPVTIGDQAAIFLRARIDPYPHTVYFVSPDGDDGNPGTEIDAPLATIQEAADRMAPGDTCYIREGTYRESVTVPYVADSSDDLYRIFRAYPGENPIIRGDDPIPDTAWEHHEGSIYKTTLSRSTDEVYANGELLWMARWPNAPSLDPLEPAWSYMDAMPGQYYQLRTIYPRLHDLEIDQPPGTWTGAKIYFIGRERWWSRSGTIREHGPLQGDLDLQLPDQLNDLWLGVMPAPQAPFFIYDSYAALDAPGEWYLDEANTLYLISPDGGPPQGITVKSRDVLFELTSRRRVRVQDLQFFSGRVRMHNATDCIVESNTFTHLSPFFFIRYPTERDREEFSVTWITPGSGIQTSGTATGNLISGNHISRSWGDGITLGGTGNTARGNTIHDVNFIGNKMAGIFLAGEDNFIEDNTIHRTGRSGISVHTTGGHIRRNHIYNCGLINWDLGGIYMYAGFKETVGNGLEISGNLIHDIQLNNNIGPSSYQYSGSGIYLDGSTSGVDVFRNVVFNFRRYGVQLNGDSFAGRDNQNINVINNTLIDNPLSGLTAMVGGITHITRSNVLIANNAYISAEGSSSGSTFSNNLRAQPGDFIDFPNFDFRPAPGSPLIDAGSPHPPITDGFSGFAPDVGAFEFVP